MQEELQLLHLVADTVTELVGATPRDLFGRPGGMGASGSPAKHIDRLAEKKVIEILEGSDLELNLCSEEVGTVDHGAERTLIVDPIDGTTNAVRGIPFYAISLAIATTGLGDVEVGLVRNIPTGHTYVASKGEGARLDGEPIEVRSLEEGAALCSHIVHPETIGQLPAAVRDARYTRDLGAAALELCLVAQGAMDVFIHTSTGLRIVDIAAGALIVEEAGGTVVGPTGQPPELGFDVSDRVNLVAAGDERAISELGVVA